MKLALKLTALAMVGAFAASAQAPELRGGVAVLADIANEKATDFVEDDRKKNAAQKRQEKRDRRRRKDNPNRSQREEDRERKRKYSQSKSRGKPCADPSQPGCGNRNFDRNREERRSRNCSKYNEGCGHSRSGTNEPNEDRRKKDSDCKRRCRDERARNCRCEELVNIEDVELMTDFFEKYSGNVEAMANFLFEAYGFDEEYDSEDEDSSSQE